MARLELEVGVRRKNQITLPELVAKRLNVEPGDRLVFVIDEDRPEQIRVRRIRRSYAGVLSGVYGTPEQADAHVRDERASWGE